VVSNLGAGTRAPAPTVPPPGACSLARHLTSSRRYTVCLCACVWCAGFLPRLRPRRRPHPCQRLGVTLGNPFTLPLVPQAAVLHCPPQHLKMPVASGVRTRLFIPRAVAPPCPLQHHQVPAISCNKSTSPSPRAVVSGQWCSRAPCNTARCPPPAAPDARPVVKRAPMLPRPPQHLQAPTRSSVAHTSAQPTGSRSPWPTPAARQTNKTP
jgi:hypothetical protein